MLSREEFFREMNDIKTRINHVEEMISEHVDNVHSESVSSITENEGVIVDLEIGLKNLSDRVDQITGEVEGNE